jgi:hypothetical protein
MRLEGLLASTRSAELLRLVYTVERIGETQHILPHAITKNLKTRRQTGGSFSTATD